MPLPKPRFKGLGPSPEAGPFKLPSATRRSSGKTVPMKNAKKKPGRKR